MSSAISDGLISAAALPSIVSTMARMITGSRGLENLTSRHKLDAICRPPASAAVQVGHSLESGGKGSPQLGQVPRGGFDVRPRR